MSYRLIQDNMVVAQCDTERDVLHYASVYLEDGPVEIQKKSKKGGWKKIVLIDKGGRLI